MKLYLLEPEVAGGYGENTIVENFDNVKNEQKKPIITHLHYEFSGWLGDELLETTPCFIVTEELANSIINSNLKGYKFEHVEISTTEEFKELYPGKKLPPFKRIIPQGVVEIQGANYSNWSGHDFCLSQTSILVVSESALDVLKKHQIKYCDITELLIVEY